jgi:hypothetical protein
MLVFSVLASLSNARRRCGKIVVSEQRKYGTLQRALASSPSSDSTTSNALSMASTFTTLIAVENMNGLA